MEIEEAKALAAALERSTLAQDALPYIPGLSREVSETAVTIYKQDEVTLLPVNIIFHLHTSNCSMSV